MRVSAIFFDVTLSKRKNGSFIKFLRMKGFRGTSTKKREQFNQMIAEAKQRKFDLLITKRFPVLREIRLTVFIIQENFARWESGFCF